jgi:cytochrome-b5 reductase
LIFGNRTKADILLKEELEAFARDKHIKFDLHFTIDREEEGWDGLVGYIDKEKILKYMPGPEPDNLIILCGRGKMCKKYLTPLLLEMGYAKENIFIF